MSEFKPGSESWLAQIKEEILEPERAIIDPHHHLWKQRFNRDYLLADLWSDTDSGHNIVKTMFMECRAFYHREGEEHLKSVGETATVATLALESQANTSGKATIAGIVVRCDLTLAGESKELLLEALEQHRVVSKGLLRGIRQPAAYDARPEDLFNVVPTPPNLLSKEAFRQGLRIIAEQGLTYDTWHYHHQNLDFLDLARAVPECTMVLDHFGTPLGVGAYKTCREEIFQKWKEDIRQIAKCPNVYAKLGGLAMPDNGFGWHLQSKPPSSDEFIKAQQKYYMHTIERFGPERCMFESNFPVDRLSISYHVLFNAYKKMVADFSTEEKHAMFYGTAEKVYSLQD